MAIRQSYKVKGVGLSLRSIPGSILLMDENDIVDNIKAGLQKRSVEEALEKAALSIAEARYREAVHHLCDKVKFIKYDLQSSVIEVELDDQPQEEDPNHETTKVVAKYRERKGSLLFLWMPEDSAVEIRMIPSSSEFEPTILSAKAVGLAVEALLPHVDKLIAHVVEVPPLPDPEAGRLLDI